MSVYHVTEIIGTSKSSWEDAARMAIASAAESMHDLRVAEVVAQDIALNNMGEIESYRTKLRVSFKYEEGLQNAIGKLGKERLVAMMQQALSNG